MQQVAIGFHPRDMDMYSALYLFNTFLSLKHFFGIRQENMQLGEKWKKIRLGEGNKDIFIIDLCDVMI